MKLHYIQHVPFETPGEISVWAQSKGFEVAGSRMFAGDPPPEVDGYEATREIMDRCPTPVVVVSAPDSGPGVARRRISFPGAASSPLRTML